MKNFERDASDLYKAVDRGDLASVQKISGSLKKKSDIEVGYKDDSGNDQSPLLHAAYKGRVDIVKALLDAGASVSRPSVIEEPTQYLIINPLTVMVDKALKDSDFLALIRDTPKIKKALSAEGKNHPNGACYTQLYDAVSQGQHARAKMLLEVGVDPNQGLTEADGAHVSPLHHAIHRGDVEAVKLLLAYGANPNYGFKGLNGERESPLQYAIEAQRYDIAKILIGHSDIDVALVPGGDLREFLQQNVKNDPELITLTALAEKAASEPLAPPSAVKFKCPPAPFIPRRPSVSFAANAAATFVAAASYSASIAPTPTPTLIAAPAASSSAGVSLETVGVLVAVAATFAAGLVALGVYLGRATAVPVVATQAPVGPFNAHQQGKGPRQGPGPQPQPNGF